jgi:pimeloyl-ACP methyl ester carboxylesterase
MVTHPGAFSEAEASKLGASPTCRNLAIIDGDRALLTAYGAAMDRVGDVNAAADGWERSEIHLSSGRMSVMLCGPPAGQLVICVPGLSQDERSFEHLGRHIVAGKRRVAAVALRGRGRSEVTAPGSYGLPSHARDLLELATILGASRFDLVGWSMGGLVGMQLAVAAPERLGRLVLVDIAGRPDAAAVAVIAAGIQRLGAVYPSPDAYVARVVASGVVDACRDAWARYLPGDLVMVEGGFTSRTSRQAVLEDAAFNAQLDPFALWTSLSMPVLLLRASVPITPGGGFVVTPEDVDRFIHEVAQARVVEISANHYCIGSSAASARAIRDFLDS